MSIIFGISIIVFIVMICYRFMKNDVLSQQENQKEKTNTKAQTDENKKQKEEENNYITARSRVSQRKLAYLWFIQDILEIEYDIYWNITGDSYKSIVGDRANIMVDEETLEYIDVDAENGYVFNKNHLFDEDIITKDEIEKIIMSIEPEKYQYILTPPEILIQREVENPQVAIFSTDGGYELYNDFLRKIDVCSQNNKKDKANNTTNDINRDCNYQYYEDFKDVEKENKSNLSENIEKINNSLDICKNDAEPDIALGDNDMNAENNNNAITFSNSTRPILNKIDENYENNYLTTHKMNSKTTLNDKKEFDLNIEKILEHWEVHHAIREIIANAIDEQTITDTSEIKIYKSKNNCWHIRDYGRGLNYHHLTQNENKEKLENDKLIGKFGIGLKDALATLYRHNVGVNISSKYGLITLSETSKNGFNDIITLHAIITPPENTNMIGTDFYLTGCRDIDIEKAKSLFLKFSESFIIETTKYGQIIKRNGDKASIYINGVLVAEENNFLFSYNITSLTKTLRKALNRERSNVGRSAYTDRIKSIILESDNMFVAKEFASDLRGVCYGTNHDETSWSDVQMHISKNIREDDESVVFVTVDELESQRVAIDEIKMKSGSIVVIPNELSNKMENVNSIYDNSFCTLNQYKRNTEAELCIKVIDIKTLSKNEKEIYDKTEAILSLVNKPITIDILITEQIYSDTHERISGTETSGLWFLGKIFIKRNQLSSLSKYASVLLHEYAHAVSHQSDSSREFENQLTSFLGLVASKVIK